MTAFKHYVIQPHLGTVHTNQPLEMFKISEKTSIAFFVIFENVRKNEFSRRLLNIRLRNVAVAASRVGVRPSRCSLKWGKSVDVYKTFARIILLHGAEARAAN